MGIIGEMKFLASRKALPAILFLAVMGKTACADHLPSDDQDQMLVQSRVPFGESGIYQTLAHSVPASGIISIVPAVQRKAVLKDGRPKSPRTPSRMTNTDAFSNGLLTMILGFPALVFPPAGVTLILWGAARMGLAVAQDRGLDLKSRLFFGGGLLGFPLGLGMAILASLAGWPTLAVAGLATAFAVVGIMMVAGLIAATSQLIRGGE